MQPKILAPIAIMLYSSVCLAEKQKEYEPCGVQLNKISTYSAEPGEEFYLYGRFGKEQGEKIVAINKGRGNDLKILKWSRHKLKAEVPERLKPGIFRVGIYCNDPRAKGGTYSSGWYDFEVLDEK